MKFKEIQKQFWISSIIKFYSLIVIIVQVFVLAYNTKLDDDPAWASAKDWLQIVGLKANALTLSHYDENGVEYTEEEYIAQRDLVETRALRGRMVAMVIFFLSSIYLSNLFSSKMKAASDDESFTEQYYKLLFEFRLEKKKSKNDTSSSSDDDEAIDDDHQQESIYKKRNFYT